MLLWGQRSKKKKILLFSMPKKRKHSISKKKIEDVDAEFFSSYDDVKVHSLMLEDVERVMKYQEAIIEYHQYFTGKVILDAGSGTGILSLLVSKHGNPKKVIAIEAATGIYKLSKEIIKLNGFENIIEVHNCALEELNLSEKVDIIISEWMGFYLLHESMFDSLIKVRDLWLKPGGLMFPSKAIIYASPCDLSSLMRDKITIFDDLCGLDFAPMKSLLFEEMQSKPYIGLIDKEFLLSKNPQKVLEIDTLTEKRKNFQCHCQFVINETTTTTELIRNNKVKKMHGICFWFDCQFYVISGSVPSSFTSTNDINGENSKQVIPGNIDKIVCLSTGPYANPTHWKQSTVIFPTIEGFTMEETEVVNANINFQQDDNNHRHYNISIELQ